MPARFFVGLVMLWTLVLAGAISEAGTHEAGVLIPIELVDRSNETAQAPSEPIGFTIIEETPRSKSEALTLRARSGLRSCKTPVCNTKNTVRRGFDERICRGALWRIELLRSISDLLKRARPVQIGRSRTRQLSPFVPEDKSCTTDIGYSRDPRGQ